ncbi:MAG: hypothetical protein ACOC2V_00055 [Alkalispirochaeta sp.]
MKPLAVRKRYFGHGECALDRVYHIPMSNKAGLILLAIRKTVKGRFFSTSEARFTESFNLLGVGGYMVLLFDIHCSYIANTTCGARESSAILCCFVYDRLVFLFKKKRFRYSHRYGRPG